MDEIETMNKFLIAGRGDSLVALKPLPQMFSADDALLLAAYLVSMADGHASHRFEDVLDAVRLT